MKVPKTGIFATCNAVPSGALLVRLIEMKDGRAHQIWASTIYDIDYAERLVAAINAVLPTSNPSMPRRD